MKLPIFDTRKHFFSQTARLYQVIQLFRVELVPLRIGGNPYAEEALEPRGGPHNPVWPLLRNILATCLSSSGRTSISE